MSKVNIITPSETAAKVVSKSIPQMKDAQTAVLSDVKTKTRPLIDLSTEELGFFRVGNRIVNIKFPR